MISWWLRHDFARSEMLSMRKASTLVTVTILNPCGRAKPTRTFTQVTTPPWSKPSCNHLVRSCCLYDLVYVNVLPSIPNHLVKAFTQKSFTPPGKTVTRCIVVTLITRAQLPLLYCGRNKKYANTWLSIEWALEGWSSLLPWCNWPPLVYRIPCLLFILRIINAGINRFHTSLWQ